MHHKPNTAYPPPVSDLDVCPLAKYQGRLLINAGGRLKVEVSTHPKSKSYGYVATANYEGHGVGEISRAATASLALLGAVQLAATHGHLQLYTPIVPGLMYDIEIEARDFRGLVLRRTGQIYTVLGALRRHAQQTVRWYAFCEGFEGDLHQGEPNSFEALLRCVDFMIDHKIWL